MMNGPPINWRGSSLATLARKKKHSLSFKLQPLSKSLNDMVKLTGRFSLKLVCPLLLLGFLVASSFSLLPSLCAVVVVVFVFVHCLLLLVVLFWAYVDEDDDDGDDDEYLDSGAVCV